MDKMLLWSFIVLLSSTNYIVLCVFMCFSLRWETYKFWKDCTIFVSLFFLFSCKICFFARVGVYTLLLLVKHWSFPCFLPYFHTSFHTSFHSSHTENRWGYDRWYQGEMSSHNGESWARRKCSGCVQESKHSPWKICIKPYRAAQCPTFQPNEVSLTWITNKYFKLFHLYYLKAVSYIGFV